MNHSEEIIISKSCKEFLFYLYNSKFFTCCGLNLVLTSVCFANRYKLEIKSSFDVFIFICLIIVGMSLMEVKLKLPV